jgi:hypothetical protein
MSKNTVCIDKTFPKNNGVQESCDVHYEFDDYADARTFYFRCVGEYYHKFTDGKTRIERVSLWLFDSFGEIEKNCTFTH